MPRSDAHRPTTVMKVQLNLPPLHLFIMREARTAVFIKVTEDLETTIGTLNRSIVEELQWTGALARRFIREHECVLQEKLQA